MAFAVIILIMVVGSFLSIQVSKKSLLESIGQTHVVQTRQIMENIDREIYYRIEEIIGYGRDVLLRESLEESNRAMAAMTGREEWIRLQDRAWRAAPEGSVTPFMTRLMNSQLAEELQEKKEFYTQDWLRHPVYPEMFVTNRYGVVAAATARTPGYLQAGEDWYREAMAAKDFWLGDMVFDRDEDMYSCDIVVKLYDEEGEFSGLFKAVLNLEIIQAAVKDEANRHADQGQHEKHLQAKLLSRDNRLIFSSDPGYELGENLSGQDFVRHISQGNRSGFFRLAGDIPGEGEELFSYAVSAGYRDYEGLGWRMVLEHDIHEISAPVASFAGHMWGIAAIMAAVALLFTYYFSQSFTSLVKELQARTAELGERIKELNCLYGIAKLVENEENSMDEILEGAAALIAESWQYPEISAVRINLDDQNFQTDNFKETSWRQSRDILVSGNKAGAVEVFYLEERPEADEGPFLMEEGKLLGIIAEQLARVQERVQARQEKKQMEAFVFQQEKLASVGQLAAGVAHEINNPIGYIYSNLGTLKKYLGKLVEYFDATTSGLTQEELQHLRKAGKIDFIVEDVRDLINESVEGTERVREIVQNLKSFSRVDEVKCKESDINECLENTIKVIWNELKYKVKVAKEYGELPPIRCYPQQLNQVFMNFLVNAAQAIDKEGEITIRTWQDEGNIFVSIADTGQGIPAENMHKLFEPFFTTKETGKGTGLGLSIAHEIIQKHNGRIEVESEVGKGTTFTVALPVAGIAE